LIGLPNNKKEKNREIYARQTLSDHPLSNRQTGRQTDRREGEDDKEG
jgi:hypothetical protein